MNLHPQQPSFNNPPSEQEQDLHLLPNYRMNKNMRKEGKRAQVTIIYEEKVFVFSEVSSEKAEQILLLAEHDGASPQIYTQLNQPVATSTSRSNTKQWNHSVNFPSFVESVNQDNNFDVSMDHMTLGLPIARRKSLNRFLEKRIDRCGGRGPYHNNLAAMSQPEVESKWWLGLATQPPQ